MKYEDALELLKGIPFISPARARVLYDFIIEHRPENCLELGFAHGVSACYIAAALDEIGAGHIDAVDLESGKKWQDPSIEELLDITGLRNYVTVHREGTSYTWFLKKLIEKNSKNYTCAPIFDFCFIDGPKNWTIDGAAFFMVDKLLREGGYILFDDMTWSYKGSSNRTISLLKDAGVIVESMEDDEKDYPQIEAVFRLLVMQHANYSEFVIQDKDWGWARKVSSDRPKLTIEKSVRIRQPLARALRKLLNWGHVGLL